MSDRLLKALDCVVKKMKSWTPEEMNSKLEASKDSAFAKLINTIVSFHHKNHEALVTISSSNYPVQSVKINYVEEITCINPKQNSMNDYDFRMAA